MTEARTLTLADFLLARIAEDEAAAAAAADEVAPVWHALEYAYEGIGVSRGPLCAGDVLTGSADMTSTTEHITRFSPAHVLAECKAKRRIVELHAPEQVYLIGGCEHEPGTPVYGCGICLMSGTMLDGICDTLLVLAQPYADHPDFRDEWRH